MIWTFVTFDGVNYPFPSSAATYEAAIPDFDAYLGLPPESFVEFMKTINPDVCFPGTA